MQGKLFPWHFGLSLPRHFLEAFGYYPCSFQASHFALLFSAKGEESLALCALSR